MFQTILAVLLLFAPLFSSSFISPRPLQRSNPSLHMGKVEDEAKQVVRDYVAAFNAGDMTKLEELLAENAEIQGVLGKGTFSKIEPIWRQLIEGYGMQLEIQDLIAQGSTVAARYIERGTFRNAAFGHEPTGKSYELVAMEFFDIENGKIQRRWGARDAASQARQLGLPSDR